MLREYHLEKEQFSQGLSDQQIIQDYSGATLDEKALLQTGLVYSALENRREAIVSISIGSKTPDWLPDTILELKKLTNLPTNWDSYGGEQIPGDLIFFSLKFIISIMRNNTPTPSIVPTSSGGIQLEWHTDQVDLEIEINPERRISFIFENTETGESFEEDNLKDNNKIFHYINEL